MKKSILSIIVLCFLFMNAQAQWGNWSGKKIKGNKNVIEKNIKVSDYESIKVSGPHDVKLVAGTEGNITIKGEENLIPYIKIEVVDGVLKVYKENGYSFRTNKPIIITVPVEQISAAILSGSGSIVGETLIQSDEFYASVTGSGEVALEVETTNITTKVAGSGDLEIQGTTTNHEASVSGSGDLDAYNLVAENTKVKVNGSGDARVHASQGIDAKVSGSGDIQYKGNPEQVKTKTSGSGDIQGR